MTEREFEEAYSKGFSKTVRMLIHKRVPEAFVEEVAQDIWLRVWQHRDQLKERGCMDSWIRKITYNRFAELTRYGKLDLHTSVPGDCAINHTERSLALRMDWSKFLGSSEYGYILYLSYFCGHTEEETAEICGITVPAVKGKRFRGRRQAREFGLV